MIHGARALRAVYLGLGLIALATALHMTATLSSAGSATVSIQPPSQNVEVGTDFTIEIAVTDVAGLAGWEVGLAYDPGIIKFKRFEGSAFLGSTGRSVSCFNPGYDQGPGTVLIGCGSRDQTPPGPSGGATVAVVTFSTIAPGTTNLEFLRAQLVDPNGDDCCGAVSIDEGAVRVIEQGGDEEQPPPATPTPDRTKLTPTVPPGAPTPDPGVVLPTPGASAAPTSTPAGATPAPPIATVGPGQGPAGAGASGAAGGTPAGGAGQAMPGVTSVASDGTGRGALVAGSGPPERNTNREAAAAAIAVLGSILLAAGILGRVQARPRS